jgi:ABC-type transport system involved in multi-copper enzyme maturation permease subunit
VTAETLTGVSIVARQEFRIRIRTGRWRWLLMGWVILLAGVTTLLDFALHTSFGFGGQDNRQGMALFGLNMLFVLAMVMVISPALTAQSINGDRERGTLATLQVTGLRPLEIALGKLAAGWAVGLSALALTLPFTGYAMTQGGVTIGRVVAVYAVAAILIGVVCAISLALSAMLVRTVTSTLLAYLTVATLTVGTIVAFSVALPLVSQTYRTRLPDGTETTRQEDQRQVIWWLLAPNPFVVVADAAPPVGGPRNPDDIQGGMSEYDILQTIGQSVRSLRSTPNARMVPGARPEADLPVWPYGLGFNILLGVGAIAITAQRLRTPTDKLPTGSRIA